MDIPWSQNLVTPLWRYGLGIVLGGNRATVHPNDSRGNADDRSPIWDVLRHDRVRSDPDIRTDSNSADHYGSCSDVYIVAKDRAPIAYGAYSHVMVNDEVSAGAYVRINDNAQAMHNHKPRSDIRVAANRGVGRERIQAVDDGGENFEAMCLAESHHAVHDLRSAAIIDQHAQKRAASRRQLVDDGFLSEVGDQIAKHWHLVDPQPALGRAFWAFTRSTVSPSSATFRSQV
jgi:hypothetical protein